MREKALLLIVGVFLCGLIAGCHGGLTAGEVAESYGLLNKKNSQPMIAELIQSGQADKMIEDGRAEVRNRINGFGYNRILVTEFLIHGEVYRVEVRQSINPMQNVPPGRVRYGESKQGLDSKIISWFNLSRVYKALKNDSYEVRGEVAFRPWKGTDGTVHGVNVKPGRKPDWQPSPKPLDLFIRTKGWPVPDMWFRGLITNEQSSKEPFGPDGRWNMMNPGPADFTGTEVVPFVNLKLYDAIGKF